jgi:LPXTG-motif cell wall-anchored protein
MLLAAMLAMVLAAATPALSQTAVGDDAVILQYSCDQIQAAVNTQYQQGEGVGAVAGAAEELGIDQQQVLACFGTAAAAQDVVVNIDGTATAGGGGGGGGGGGSASAAAGGALPDTGGASLIALGAGALLVAGGLLARRIIR